MASVYDKCLKEIMKVAEGALTSSEAEQLFDVIRQAKESIEATGVAAKQEDIRQAAGEFLERKQLVATTNKLNELVHQAGIQQTINRGKLFKSPTENIISFWKGIPNKREFAKVNVASAVKAETEKYMTQLGSELLDIQTPNGTKTAIELFRSGELSRRIAYSLAAKSDPTIAAPVVDKILDPVADQVANIIHKYRTEGFNRLNNAGANVVPLRGFIGWQSWSSEKMLWNQSIKDLGLKNGSQEAYEAAYKAWRDDWFPRLDWEKTLKADASFLTSSVPNSQIKKLLSEKGITDFTSPQAMQAAVREKFMWQSFKAMVSDVRMTGEGNSEEAAFNMAKIGNKFQYERLFHFNSPDDYLSLLEKYGSGSFQDTLVHELESYPKNATLMSMATMNPMRFARDQIQALLVEHRTDIAACNELKANARYIENVVKNLTGFTNVDNNPTLTGISDGIRAFNALNSMWFSTLKSLPDVAGGASIMATRGAKYYEVYANALGAVFGTLDKEAMRENMYWAQGALQVAALSREELFKPGLGSKLQDWLFRVNGQHYWDNVVQTGAMHTAARLMGRYSAHDFEHLATVNPKFFSSLQRYGITGDRWNVIRRAVLDHGEDAKYITGEQLRNLDNGVFEAYMVKQGQKVSPLGLQKTKDEMAMLLNLYIRDAGYHTVATPMAGEMAMLNQGLQRGSGLRVALDQVTQFKSFTVTNYSRVIREMLYSQGAEHMGQVVTNWATVSELARFIGATTMLYYAGNTAAQSLKGLTPEDPRRASTWYRAVLGGGGFGPFAEMLLKDYGDYKTTVVGTLAGPTVSKMERGASILSQYRKAAASEIGLTGDKDYIAPNAQAIKYASSLLPNVPVMTALLNQLAIDQAAEWADPGYIKRRNKRIKDDTGQETISSLLYKY